MEYILHNHENLLRFIIFSVVLSILLLWELWSPKRSYLRVYHRRLHNLALALINVLCVRYLLPIAAITAAEISAVYGWGVLSYINAGYWLTFIVSILLLDLLIYGQHVLMHKVPVLWRLHRVHHTDPEFDVTTALRFHPLEIILSMCLKVCVVIVIGAPTMAVLVFEIILNAAAMFNHSNIAIPQRIDRCLHWLLVTPDMHRIHHSVVKCETNSNYGFSVPWWDHLFSTYRAQPLIEHAKMKIGLYEFQGDKTVLLHWLLWQPFAKIVSSDDNKDNYS